MHEVPGSLRSSSAFPFVGRSSELDTLRTLLPRAEGEGRRVVLIAGEAGSGKSRLVREFAVEAAAGGARVLYGACDAAVRSPYQPFIEGLDQLVRTTDVGELRAALGSAGGELTRLLPELGGVVGDLQPPVQADPDTERHRLHLAVTDVLARVSRGRPVLLVLEDGHWADGPSLLLLRHLARAAGHARLLLLATFRDTEGELPQALAEALADLRRADDVVRLRLGGLTEADVAEFVRLATAGSGAAELAGAISALTGGNAFLVCELWRALVETGAVEVVDGTIRLIRPLGELGTPESVREVVTQRLARLDPSTRSLLEVAATAGADFELDVVRRAAGLAEPDLLAAFDEAVRNGFIEELPARRLGYRFTHELVRRALYDRLSGPVRAQLHERVGRSLEARPGRQGRALADLAHHFAAAAPLGDVARGVEYNLLAGRSATAALAFDEAAERLRTALELGIEDPAQRAQAFLDLGDAGHRAGRAGDALDAFREAAEIGRALGDAELLARAAIGYEEACWRPGITDEGAVELLTEATNALGDEYSPLRVGLLGGLARALHFRGEHARGATVRKSAVALARRLQDRRGLATVLVRSYWSRGTSSLEEILEMLTEAKALAEELDDTDLRAEAISWLVPTFVALLRMDEARDETALARETADATAQPFVCHVAAHYGSAIALGDGRLAEADALARSSQEWGRLLTGRNPSGTHGIQMFGLRREQGRLAELAPVVRVLAGSDREVGPWRPGLACVLAELGMEREARRELARVADEGLDAFRASLWLGSLVYLADAAAALGDERMAALVYPELEPFTGANMMIGHLVAWYGAADRYLGMLAATLGEWEPATAHFERALELNRRMGAGTWVAHTAYEYGRMLARLGPERRAAAERLLGEAATLGERIGMPALLARIESLGAAAPRAELPAGLSQREAEILGLVARGLSNREIGAELYISEHTAANHIRSILRKTGCANRTEAASYAHRHGLAESERSR
jgi:DNA-binding CsgD family transcriptional regulator